jgi:hypothetical protein
MYLCLTAFSVSWNPEMHLATNVVLLVSMGGGILIADTLSSRHVSLCDVTRAVGMRDDLTLNSMVQIHTSVTLLASRDLEWSSGRLTCQHASQISAVAHISWDVTYVSSALQTLPVCFHKWRKCLLKKCANGPFCMTPSYQIIEISNESQRMGKDRKGVSSHDVRIVCPWPQPYYVTSEFSTYG